MNKIEHKTLQEWQILKRLNHANIVNGKACYFDTGKKFQIIVMEYCQCGDLAQLI